jgi:hypothetical protein
MNYELAKQLKDAGFASKEIGRLLGFSEDEKISAIQGVSLSALIEACGDSFEFLKRHKDAFEAKGLKTFSKRVYADETYTAKDLIPDEHFRALGRTPEEAVARLYLSLFALNKK